MLQHRKHVWLIILIYIRKKKMEEEQVMDMVDIIDDAIATFSHDIIFQILLDDKTTWADCYDYQDDAIQTFSKFGKYRCGMKFNSVEMNACCEIISAGVMQYDLAGYQFTIENATNEDIESFGFESPKAFLLKMTREDGSSTLLFDGNTENELPTKKK